MFAGYWVLLIVAVHLGTRWDVVMNVFRTTFGLQQPNPVRAWACRIITLGVVAWGVNSFSTMEFGSKLMLTYSLDMWDFNESTPGFFVNYASIIGLFAAATHYCLMFIRYRRRKA